jgi:hypothetical protein
VTVIHSTASAQSRVATLHLIVHDLPVFLVVPVVIAMPAPHGIGDRIGRGADVTVAHRNCRLFIVTGNSHKKTAQFSGMILAVSISFPLSLYIDLIPLE